MSVQYKQGKWCVIENGVTVSKHESRAQARKANQERTSQHKQEAPKHSCSPCGCATNVPDLSVFEEIQVMAANLKVQIDKFVADTQTVLKRNQTPENPSGTGQKRKWKKNGGIYDLYLNGQYMGSCRDEEAARLGLRYLKTLKYLPEQDMFFHR